MTVNKNANLTQAEKVLEYVEITGAVMEKTSAMLAKQASQDAQIKKLIPAAVKALLENERIEPHEKDAAAKVLKDPIKVLEILIKTASHRNNSEVTNIGSQTTKSASGYNSLNDGYAGRRIRPGESESDKAFKRGLGF